jgi:hypothetical protein
MGADYLHDQRLRNSDPVAEYDADQLTYLDTGCDSYINHITPIADSNSDGHPYAITDRSPRSGPDHD